MRLIRINSRGSRRLEVRTGEGVEATKRALRAAAGPSTKNHRSNMPPESAFAYGLINNGDERHAATLFIAPPDRVIALGAHLLDQAFVEEALEHVARGIALEPGGDWEHAAIGSLAGGPSGVTRFTNWVDSHRGVDPAA